MSDEARRGVLAFLAAALLLALAHWVVLAFQVPVFAVLPGWFHAFTWKPPGSAAVVATLVVLPALALAAIAATPGRPRLHLALVFTLGVALQFALAFTEYRGEDALRDRMVYTGHAEFAEEAVQADDVLLLLRDYEPLVASGELGLYAPSKPPGQLLLYVATERLANVGDPSAGRGVRLRRLRTFAAWTWPVASMLVLFPLFVLARGLADAETAVLACLLYVFVPSVQLVTLHTDQAFFPLLFLLPLLVAAQAGRPFPAAWGAAAGVLAYAAAFASFGLLPALPLAVVVALAAASGPARDRGRRAALFGAGMLAGFAATYAVFSMLLGYDALGRFRRAVAYHAAWKGGPSGFAADLGFAEVNAIEFALFLGLPLALLFVVGLARAARRLAVLSPVRVDALALAVGAVLIALAVFGRTQGEVARLWLFLVPLVCLVSAAEAHARLRPMAAVVLLLLLQAGTVYLTKRFMDFA